MSFNYFLGFFYAFLIRIAFDRKNDIMLFSGSDVWVVFFFNMAG